MNWDCRRYFHKTVWYSAEYAKQFHYVFHKTVTAVDGTHKVQSHKVWQLNTMCYLKVDDWKVHSFRIMCLLYFLKYLYSHWGNGTGIASCLMGIIICMLKHSNLQSSTSVSCREVSCDLTAWANNPPTANSSDSNVANCWLVLRGVWHHCFPTNPAHLQPVRKSPDKNTENDLKSIIWNIKKTEK